MWNGMPSIGIEIPPPGEISERVVRKGLGRGNRMISRR